MDRDVIKYENRYRDSLISRVNIVEGRDYSRLLHELYLREFYAIVEYDEDRAADGVALREAWAEDTEYRGELNFGPCSMLELLIAISLRMEFQLFGGRWADEWDYKKIFWNLVDNLGLMRFEGRLESEDVKEIMLICDAFCAKKRHCDTFVNIFDFFVTPKGVQKMSLWTQMGLYIREKWPF